MNRHASAEKLSLYLDRQVGAKEGRRIEQHLSECPDCRLRLEGLERVIAGLGEIQRSAPPESLGLRLQSRLSQAAPPFHAARGGGRRLPRVMFQASTLASLGVVLALAVIMLLFLYALQREQSAPPLGPGVDPSAVSESGAPVAVVIGGRSFRSVDGGWAESDLSAEAIAAAAVERRPALEQASEDLRPVLERLRGEVTLRRGDSVVRLVEDD